MIRADPTEQFLLRLRESLADETFVSLVLSGAVPSENNPERLEVRLIHLQGRPRLSFTTKTTRKKPPSLHPAAGTPTIAVAPAQANPLSPGRVITRNFVLEAGLARLREQLTEHFRNALLRTTRRDWQWHRAADGEAKLVGHKPARPTAPSREHDQPKKTLLGEEAGDWLQALGIADIHGRPKPSMADKHRQVSRYTEILQHLARDCGWADQDARAPRSLRLADMGCGKGYLTFAAWHLFRRTLHRPVSLVGVETRAELVNGANRVARRIQAEGLEFIQGNIASVPLSDLDGLIALHACNTATDDAIRRGIDLGARLIVVAPCCHQALRPELGAPEPFAALLRHGLFKERLAEWLTDGLRTLFLEWAGYQTRVIEFVASEHTPKNLMLAAVQRRKPFADEAAKQRILELKRFFGIQHHALDSLLE